MHIVVQLLSCVWLFVTQWIAAYQASLFFTISQGLLRLMSTESVMPSNHLILSHPPFLLPSIFLSTRVFYNELALRQSIGGQSIGASASASVLPMSIQGWFHLGLTGWISLLSKGLSRVFSSTTVQKQQFFIAQPSLWSSPQWILTGLIPVASKPSRGLCHLSFPSFPSSVTHPLPYNSPVFTTYFLHLALLFKFHDLHPRLDLITW